MEEREIDLLEYLLRELRKWKLLVIAALLGGLLIGCGGYIRSKRSYDTQISDIELQYSDIDEQIKKLTDNMSEDEADASMDYYEMTTSLASQEEYLNNSLLMQVDGNNVHKMEYVIAVSQDNPDNDDINKLADIREYVSSSMHAENFVDEIRSQYYSQSTNQYVQEMIMIDEEGVGKRYAIKVGYEPSTIRLVVVIPNNADGNDCNTIVENYIKIIGQELNGCSVKVIGDNDVYSSDVNIIANQRDFYTYIDNYRIKLETAEGKLSSEQKQLADLLIAKNAVDNGDTEGISKQEAIDEVVKPGISIKYILVGAFLGIIFIMGIDFITLIVGDKVNYLNDVSAILAIRPLLAFYDGADKGFFNNSKLIYNMQYKKYSDMDKQVDNFTRMLNSLSHDKNVDNITFVVPGKNDDTDIEYIEKIKGIARATGVNITEQVIDTIGYINTGSQLIGNSPIIIYVRQRCTNISALVDVKDMATENDRDIIGFVYVDC